MSHDSASAGWKHKPVLVERARDLPGIPRSGFTGATLTLKEQRACSAAGPPTARPPDEALVGLLALLHVLSNVELRNLCVDNYDSARRTLRVARRLRPVPLDAVSCRGAAALPYVG